MEEIQEKLNKSENVTTDNEALTQIAKVMDAVKKWLSEEGYKCNVDEDGDFTFKYQGKHVYFIKDNDDPIYYRAIMPSIYDIETIEDYPRIIDICNGMNSRRKGLKAYVLQNSVWLTVELFLDPDNCYITTYLERCLDILLESYYEIAREILSKDKEPEKKIEI